MPIATPERYAEMLDAAKTKSFAYPAINVSSSQTLNAALQGFAEAGSDGIIQISTGHRTPVRGSGPGGHGKPQNDQTDFNSWEIHTTTFPLPVTWRKL